VAIRDPLLDTRDSQRYTSYFIFKLRGAPWFQKLSLLLSVFLLALPVFVSNKLLPNQSPVVIVVGVNGMELDIIRPLLLGPECEFGQALIEERGLRETSHCFRAQLPARCIARCSRARIGKSMA